MQISYSGDIIILFDAEGQRNSKRCKRLARSYAFILKNEEKNDLQTHKSHNCFYKFIFHTTVMLFHVIWILILKEMDTSFLMLEWMMSNGELIQWIYCLDVAVVQTNSSRISCLLSIIDHTYF